MWNFRELTLAGKIQIFKSLALSKAVYVCTMTSPSQKFLNQSNLLKRNFIWAGKSAKINTRHQLVDMQREVRYAPFVKEGLRM